MYSQYDVEGLHWAQVYDMVVTSDWFYFTCSGNLTFLVSRLLRILFSLRDRFIFSLLYSRELFVPSWNSHSSGCICFCYVTFSNETAEKHLAGQPGLETMIAKAIIYQPRDTAGVIQLFSDKITMLCFLTLNWKHAGMNFKHHLPKNKFVCLLTDLELIYKMYLLN